MSDKSSKHHRRSHSWDGWKDGQFALEVQKPWAEWMLNGHKTTETRAYDLPPALWNRKLWILESSSTSSSPSSLPRAGTAPTSKLGDRIEDVWNDDEVAITGWCIFSSVVEYHSKSEFYNDEHLHRVERKSPFGWKTGDTPCKLYGWKVKEVSRDITELDKCYQSAVRRMRSLYELVTMEQNG